MTNQSSCGIREIRQSRFVLQIADNSSPSLCMSLSDSNTARKRAPWITIQSNTFTRWMNTYLTYRQMQIDSVKDGYSLCDGVALINLLEILSGKTIPGRWHKNP